MTYKTDKYFWIANIVIVISLVLFFSRSLFTNRILAPGDFQTYPFFVSDTAAMGNHELSLGDPIAEFIPWFHFNKQILDAWKLPLWNPYQGCGAPNIANMQSAFFYPLNIFVYVLNWKWGLFFLYFFKLYFIGLFLYFYLREIDISPPVAIVSSMAGMYMSFNLVYLYYPPSNLVFFFPLSLWAIELILNKTKHFIGYFIFCLGFVVALLGGHPEILFYSIFIIIIYLLVRVFQTYRLNEYNEYLPILSKFSFTLVIGIMISSIQLLPFLEYFRISSAYLSRATLEQPIYNLPFYFLLFNILPTFTAGNVFMLFNYGVNKYQTAVIFAYTGVSFFLLGITSMIALNKDKIVRTFILILLVSLCIGFYVPFVHSVIMMIPGFSIGRNYYILIFTGWSLIILSSKVVDRLITGQISLINKIQLTGIFIFGLIMILSLFFLKDALPSTPSYIQKATIYYMTLSVAAAIIIMVLTVLILRIKNRQLLIFALTVLFYIQTAVPMIFIEPAIKPEFFYPKNNIFSMLQKEQGQPFRVTALINTNQPIAYASNINTFYRIEDIRNYDSLDVNWYNTIYSYIKESDALNLTNAKYLIVGKDFDPSSLTNILQPIAEHNGYILYKNLSAFNRAFMIYNFAVSDGQQQALDLLHAYSGQLNKIAIIFRKDVQGMPLTVNTQGTYKIDFIKYTPGYIKLSCTTSQPGLFFISNTYFPGWHASVDGKETKIIRTDYAFQGLWLTQGSHAIELKYAPSSFKYGALLSILGILSLIGFYLIVFRKKKGDIPDIPNKIL